MLGSLVSKRSLLELVSFGALGLGALSLTGCPDPEARYEEFLESSAEERGKSQNPTDYFGEPRATENQAKLEVAGRFMLAVATELDASSPLMFQADVTVVDASDPWTIDLELRPLRVQCDGAKCDERDPRFREVLDAVINTPGPVPYADVDDIGRFEINFGTVSVPGEANAISGSPIEVDLNLYGETRGDTVCGQVDGGLKQPFVFALSRDKNNFGTVRVDDGGYADVAFRPSCP